MKWFHFHHGKQLIKVQGKNVDAARNAAREQLGPHPIEGQNWFLVVKQCVKCGGLERDKNSECCSCKKARQQANPEKNAEKGRRWRQANPEKALECVRRWGQANPEKVAEFRRRWRQANPEKAAESVRRWRQANPEKAAEGKQRWRQANSEKIAESKQRWRQANSEKIAETSRRWRQANSDKTHVYESRRRKKLIHVRFHRDLLKLRKEHDA